jgi:hypothetical protein
MRATTSTALPPPVRATAGGRTVSALAVALGALLIAASPASAQGTPAGTPATTAAPASTEAPADAAPVAVTTAAPEETPAQLRLRALEQRVQALKERAWRQKARVGMLRESAIGGGTGAMASITHQNKMGSSFRLFQLVYTLDGTQIFARTDENVATMYKLKELDVFSGSIGPGSHTLTVVAGYRGHGYGVFKYLSKYTYQAKESYTFTIEEGKATKVDVRGYEKGGLKTPMEKRPSIEFKVSMTDPPKDKPAGGAPAPATPAAGAATTTPSTTVKTPGA